MICGALGVLLLAFVLVSGYDGPDTPLDNFAPTFVFIIFWVGLVFASVLFGDLFRAFNPWRAIGRVLFRDRTAARLPGVVGPLAGRDRAARLHLDRARLRLGRGARHARHRGRRLQRADADLHGRVRRRAVVAPGRDVLGLLQPLLAPVGVRDARPRGRHAPVPRRPAEARPGAGHGRDGHRDDRDRHVRRAQPGPAVEGPRRPAQRRLRDARLQPRDDPEARGRGRARDRRGDRRRLLLARASRARARSAATSTRSACGARSPTASSRSRWSTSPRTT